MWSHFILGFLFGKLAQCFEEDIMAIFCSVLTCSYFSSCHWFCGWTYTMVIGSLLVLCGQDHVIWPHRPEKLEEFVALPHPGIPSSLVFFIWHPSAVLFIISLLSYLLPFIHLLLPATVSYCSNYLYI
jgi:hypothetical protein